MSNANTQETGAIWNLIGCYASLSISLFYYLLISTLKKESLHRTYALLRQYLDTDQILLGNLSGNSKKCPLKSFFLPIFFWNDLN